MQLKLFQIDAFADKVFEGNPAAVCPLEKWLPDHILQKIAMENNLSETAFFVPSGTGYSIRWFTPTAEVDLCGHATLASAHVLFNHLGRSGNTVEFESRSGRLAVGKQGDRLELDFPNQMPEACEAPANLLRAFNLEKTECLRHQDYILVVEDLAQVVTARPDLDLLKTLDLRGVCLTAPGDTHDFVSRFFAPRYGIGEDPVTGSSFTQLAPYWGARLGKRMMRARQVSTRGGEVGCRLEGDRVFISGQAVLFMEGTFRIA